MFKSLREARKFSQKFPNKLLWFNADSPHI